MALKIPHVLFKDYVGSEKLASSFARNSALVSKTKSSFARNSQFSSQFRFNDENKSERNKFATSGKSRLLYRFNRIIYLY